MNNLVGQIPPYDTMKNLLTNPQPSQSDYINAIVKLGSRVYEAATVTPLQKMGKLSDRLHNNIWIKREDCQPVNSFKLRGAYAMISSLSSEQVKKNKEYSKC